jgi:hypothetical protein
VTLYHHRSLWITQLPANLPLEKTKLAPHDNPQNSHIVWIDMPDFDSVELANKSLVLEWLPHIDVLLYVVSPERYRDNKAWQLLKAEGGKHAWLFVMNQWDRAVPSQLEDFKRQLAKAGFADPLVLYTSCTEPDDDRFAELLQQLNALSSQQTMLQMTQHNERLRILALADLLQRFSQHLGLQDFAGLRRQFSENWQQTEATFPQGLAWAFHAYSEALANRPDGKSDIAVWDAWAQTRLNDAVENLLQLADQHHIAAKALKPRLETLKTAIAKNAAQQIELAGRHALLIPGNALQRFLMRLTAICETLLPILAMLIVGYQVYSGYYHSAAEAKAYLGVDFAVHSVLLIGLSWLMPFFLHKKLQPSLQKAALQGLHKGLLQVLSRFKAETDQALLDVEAGAKICRQKLLTAIENSQPDTAAIEDRDVLLKRVLIR